MGILFANGLTPKPQMEFWFDGELQEPLFGKDRYAQVMEKHVRKNHKVSGKQRWKNFWRYFTLCDFRDNPKESQQANPLWKVQTIINEQARRMWLPGKFVAIDEQTIGFQGASGLKLRISYKREARG